MEILDQPQNHQEVENHKKYIENNLINISFDYDGTSYKITDYFVQRFRDTSLACSAIHSEKFQKLFLARDVIEILENTKYQKSR